MSVEAWSEPPASELDKEAGEPHEDIRVLGDRIDHLFRAQAPRLLRFLTRHVGGRDEAADLVQESFLRLVRSTSHQPLPQNPEAYLRRIARNLVLDRAKHSGVQGRHGHAPLDEEMIADPGPGPAEILEAQDMLGRYELALTGLRPKTRRIFLLHRRDGLTYGQIAQETGLSVSGVEKHMMKAIAHIDRALGSL
jgi:RNA polymerase sigma-70 factor (ECF subfamily)